MVGTATVIAPIGRPAWLWMVTAERGDALLGLFDVDRETGSAHTVEFAAELVELGRAEPAIGRVEFVVAGGFEVEPLQHVVGQFGEQTPSARDEFGG